MSAIDNFYQTTQERSPNFYQLSSPGKGVLFAPQISISFFPIWVNAPCSLKWVSHTELKFRWLAALANSLFLPSFLIHPMPVFILSDHSGTSQWLALLIKHESDPLSTWDNYLCFHSSSSSHSQLMWTQRTLTFSSVNRKKT